MHPPEVTDRSIRFINWLLGLIAALVLVSLMLTLWLTWQESQGAEEQARANEVVLQRLEANLASLECILLITPEERTEETINACREFASIGR